jgi:hypothetical protein
VEMGGGGRACRAIPTHRKERDEWGTRLTSNEGAYFEHKERQLKCEYSDPPRIR